MNYISFSDICSSPDELTLQANNPRDASNIGSDQVLVVLGPMDSYLESSTITLDLTPLEATALIPCIEKYPGPNGFHIVVNDQNYSANQNRIFVEKDVNIPFAVKYNPQVDYMPYLRAVFIYTSSDKINGNVERCKCHALLDDESNYGLPKEITKHIVRCSDSRTEYCTDPLTSRLSLLVVLDPPQAGALGTNLTFSFACSNFCLNKKKTQIVFTLEDKDGKVFGRDVVGVQVSTSPKRDKKNWEKKLIEKSSKSNESRKRKTTISPIVEKKIKLEPLMQVTVPALIYKDVVKYAHNTLMGEMDLAQRGPTPQEIDLLVDYRNLLKSLEQGASGAGGDS